MAYTKHTWQCGESISADLLNHMEQGIEDASGGGSCDCGYECDISYTALYENASLEFSDWGDYYGGSFDPLVLGADPIRVTIDGVEYLLNKFSYYDDVSDTSYIGYGAPFVLVDGDWVVDFTEYPITIQQEDGSDYVYIMTTASDETHSIKIESVSTTLDDIDLCFRAAVSEAYKPYIVTFSKDGADWVSDRTYAEVLDAWNKGKMVIGIANIYSTTTIFSLSQILIDRLIFSANIIRYYQATVVDAYSFEIQDNDNVVYNHVSLS